MCLGFVEERGQLEANPTKFQALVEWPFVATPRWDALSFITAEFLPC